MGLLLEMICGSFLWLSSIEAVRPVFSIVMGIFLLVIGWRLSRDTRGWTSRTIVAGVLLLAFGYSLLLPLYDAGKIESLSPRGLYRGDAATAMAWHLVKLIVMNVGWLLLGLGLALHAKIFSRPAPQPKPATLPAHGSVIA